MCKRCEAQAAQDAAAEQLQRACAARFHSDDLRNDATVKHLPPAPADFAGLLAQLDPAPADRSRTRIPH